MFELMVIFNDVREPLSITRPGVPDTPNFALPNWRSPLVTETLPDAISNVSVEPSYWKTRLAALITIP